MLFLLYTIYWKYIRRLQENAKRGNKNGYFVGDKLTVADLKVYYGFAFVAGLDHIDIAKLLEPVKRCAAFIEKLKADKGIKKMEETFAKSQKGYTENKTKLFKYSGKFVSGSV